MFGRLAHSSCEQELEIGLLELCVPDGGLVLVLELVRATRVVREVLKDGQLRREDLFSSGSVELLDGCDVFVQVSEHPDLGCEQAALSENVDDSAVEVSVLQHPQNRGKIKHFVVEDVLGAQETEDFLFVS